MEWKKVSAQACRRHLLYDGKSTLAVFVNSISDIDDLIPSLTAYQIEWNKMNEFIAHSNLGDDLADKVINADAVKEELRKILNSSIEDWDLLLKVWDFQVLNLLMHAHL